MLSMIPCYLQQHAQQQAELSLVTQLEKTQQCSSTWPSQLSNHNSKKRKQNQQTKM